MTTGLFIGRFQPLHNGHIKVLKLMSQECDKIKLVIGSAQFAYTKDNPFTFSERRKMLTLALEELKIPNYSIIKMNDLFDYPKWIKEILLNVGHFDYIYCGNTIVKTLFSEKDYKVKELERYSDISGSLVREHTSEEGKIPTQLVHHSIRDYIRSINGIERIHYLTTNNRFKNPPLTVDAIVFHRGKLLVIERKNFPYGYALPGGFVDYGETLETAVSREVLEETGLHVKPVSLVGVFSDPSRDPRGHTVSACFECEYLDGEVKAGDDASNALFINPEEPLKYAFDHESIIKTYLKKKAGKLESFINNR